MKVTGNKKESEKMAVSICPGPNIAYFSKKVSLKSMVDHIYGRMSLINTKERPNLFIKELTLYINHFKEKITDYLKTPRQNELEKLFTFRDNLMHGIEYYINLFSNNISRISGNERTDIMEFKNLKNEVDNLISEKIPDTMEVNG
jgi:hypothetical protein